MKGPINLASRPFRNERLAGVLFAAATFVLCLVSLQHAVLVHRFWPSRTQELRDEIAGLEAEIALLRKDAAEADRRIEVPQARLVEWRVIKDLVDRRTLWWSRLLSTFEELLPREMRVVSISPRIQKDGILLDVVITTQNLDVASGFVSLLEEHPEFDSVTPTSIEDAARGGPSLTLTMNYQPPPSVAPGGTAVPPEAPVGEAAPAEEAAPTDEGVPPASEGSGV